MQSSGNVPSAPAGALSRRYRAEITAVAVALADTQGIEAVSMRALAVELGVGAASLYRYVARKDELIDLMVDAVMGNDLHFEIRGEWRADLRSVARGLRAMTLRHPWMAVHGTGRRNLGPNTARRYEEVLGAIHGLGLGIDEMLVMIETLDAFVRGRAIEDLSEQEAARRSGLSQEEWMQPDPVRSKPDRQRPLPGPIASSSTPAPPTIQIASRTASTWVSSECSMASPRCSPRQSSPTPRRSHERAGHRVRLRALRPAPVRPSRCDQADLGERAISGPRSQDRIGQRTEQPHAGRFRLVSLISREVADDLGLGRALGIL